MNPLLSLQHEIPQPYFLLISVSVTKPTLEINRVPIPDPVPPPSEWVSWKPCRHSQPSASFRTTSRTLSTNSAPKKWKTVIRKNKTKKTFSLQGCTMIILVSTLFQEYIHGLGYEKVSTVHCTVTRFT